MVNQRHDRDTGPTLRATRQRSTCLVRRLAGPGRRGRRPGAGATYHATESTIGIRGPDAADRINQLRHALAKLITKHGWTTRDEPR
jgi:hypothetical protein